MTTEEYLNSVQVYEKKIEIKAMELNRLKSIKNNVCTGSSLEERVKVQNNAISNDNVGDTVVKFIELENSVKEMVDDFIRKRNKIINQLDGMKNIKYYQVLSMRYIYNKTYKEIAEKLGYSVMQINRISKNAILEFEKMYSENYFDI